MQEKNKQNKTNGTNDNKKKQKKTDKTDKTDTSTNAWDQSTLDILRAGHFSDVPGGGGNKYRQKKSEEPNRGNDHRQTDK